MGPESLPQAHAGPAHDWRGRLRRLWPLPKPWVYVLLAAALLAASELLWLWHSWPVRQILETERPVAGVSV
jgi:hypothetical protein